MKRINQSLLCMAVCILLSCGADTPTPETERIAKLLSEGAWTLHSATVDDVDKLSLYSGLSITFTETTFTTTNGGVQWPSSGTWEFTDATAKVVERNDGLLITLEEVSTTLAVISFQWDDTTFEEGRISSLGGEHVFTFVH